MMKLRIVVTASVTALSLLTLSAPQAQARRRSTTSPETITFTLNATVLDSGQQIVSLTLDTRRLGVRASSLSADMFSVHASGTNPLPDAEPVFGTFTDVERTVTGVRLDSRGRIVISLETGYGVPGASTLAWGAGVDGMGRDIVLDLTYAITQNAPVTLRNGTRVTFSSFAQGDVVDPEVDAFGYGSAAGLNYRLYDPTGRGRRPLIVWLHGGGEGGWSKAQNNDLPLLANRGALGFATPKAQAVFGGAYVLAPQATDYWLNDPAMGYSARLKTLIDAVVRKHHIDTSRIYVVGASNGGYMTPRLVVDNPDFFAAEVPTCPVVDFAGATMLTDAELASVKTPTWVVQATSDDTVPFLANGQHIADTVPGALLSAYDDVTWGGVTYPSHWSWIYVARNAPTTDKGLPLWQWMARQSLDKGHHHHR